MSMQPLDEADEMTDVSTHLESIDLTELPRAIAGCENRTAIAFVVKADR
jgi:hypothetical protein